MHKLTFVVLCLALMATGALAQTTDLMFSEYIEGSGNNIALEIYNGTEDAINLGDYTITVCQRVHDHRLHCPECREFGGGHRLHNRQSFC